MATPSHEHGPPSLETLHGEGHLADIDLHFGRLIAELDGGGGMELPLAAALASAWARNGHACLALPEVAGRDWPRAGAARLPALESWIEALVASPMVARPGEGERRPLVLDRHGRLYLERLRTAELAVAYGLVRLAGDGSEPEPEGIDAALDRLFAGAVPDHRPRTAARTAVCRRLCVVSGGPGTGKTTTAASIVALLIELGLAAPDRIALAAPTGKAAARLQEAVRGQLRALLSRAPALEDFDPRATTVHRWLLHRTRERLPVDALILDEGSMVDLSLMAQVLRALPDGARLVVLGDASQLASVQPGSVFADLCRAGTGDERIGAEIARTDAGIGEITTGLGTEESREAGREPASSSSPPAIPRSGIARRPPWGSPFSSCVVELVRNWRFDESGGIGRLAAAVMRGDAAAAVAALLDPGDRAVELRSLPDAAAFERLAVRFADDWFEPALREARKLRGPPAEGSGPLPSFRTLCAHRVGPFGAERFNRSVERRLRARGYLQVHDAFYPGRPILVTRNDPRTRLSNGDTGVVVRDPAGRAQVWFPELKDADGRPRLVSPARLPPHESFFALTVHRAQGSEYDEVAVVPGPADSRVATRELLYTAVTRARRRVVVYGSEESVAAAVERPTIRSSGLCEALAEGHGPV